MPSTSSLELPRRIATAAERLLTEHGPRAVTHRAVAREAGVSVNSIANRFGSIDALLDHVALRGFVELHRSVVGSGAATLAPPDDDPSTLIEAGRRYRRWALANPARHRLMFDGPGHGIVPSPATRRAAADLFALFGAAGGSAHDGRRRFVELNGDVQLTLAGLAFSLGGPGT